MAVFRAREVTPPLSVGEFSWLYVGRVGSVSRKRKRIEKEKRQMVNIDDGNN